MKFKFMGEDMNLTSANRTDAQKVEALFTELGIPFSIQGNSFVLYPGRNTCVTGFHGFYTQFEFQKDGKLANIVIAE